MAPADLENGNAAGEKETQAPRLSLGGDQGMDDQQDMGEYGNLVRYISQYRDGRRASTVGGDDEAPKKKKWW